MSNDEKKTSIDIDSLVNDLYGSVSLERVAPSIPKVTSVVIVEEKNKAGEINGVNLQIAVEGTVIAAKPIVKTAEGWKVDQVNMTKTLPPRYRDQVVWGSNVSLRIGRHGEKASTYFAEHVPGVSEITDFANKICSIADQHGMDDIADPNSETGITAGLVTAGHVVMKGDSTEQGYVQMDLAKVQGFTLFKFCPIGEDGKPVLDFMQDWSLHRQAARAQLYRITNEGEQLVKGFAPSYRGTVRTKGSRAGEVATGLLTQVQALAGKELAKVTGIPRSQRTDSSSKKGSKQDIWKTRSRSSRFATQTPQASEETQESNAKAEAPANASGIEF